MKDILRVGKIVNTHGLKGEVKVIPLTDDPKRYNELEFVLIDGVKRNIEGCKYQKDRVIVKVEGINSIEEAEKYKNKYLQNKIFNTEPISPARHRLPTATQHITPSRPSDSASVSRTAAPIRRSRQPRTTPQKGLDKRSPNIHRRLPTGHNSEREIRKTRTDQPTHRA